MIGRLQPYTEDDIASCVRDVSETVVSLGVEYTHMNYVVKKYKLMRFACVSDSDLLRSGTFKKFNSWKIDNDPNDEIRGEPTCNHLTL